MRRVSVDVFLVGTRHGVSANTATSRDVISWRLKKNKGKVNNNHAKK